MLENEGHWLKLMRNAIVPTDANICLRISGGDILCTVTKDVNKEVELKVTCHIVEQLKDQLNEETESSVDNISETEAGSEGMLNFDSEQTIREKMPSNKLEMEARTSPIRKSEQDNTCDSEVKNNIDNTSNQEAPICGTKKDETCHSEESKRRRLSLSDRDHSAEENGVYKCPLCSCLIEDRRMFEKHLQSHRSSSFKRVSSHMTNAQAFCDACNIQFMSVDTYQVHKKYYCKSRHDREDPSTSPPSSEPLMIPGAFKPSPDTVILRNGTLNGTVPTPSLIQPQAIYAAISTNPLILLPCSLVSGESLVAQNGMAGIVLQTNPAIVGKQPPVLKKEDMPPNRKTSHPAMNFSSVPPEVIPEDSTLLRKRKMSEGDVLNLKKPPKLTDSEVRRSPPSDPDTPLDLSLKRRLDISYKKTSEKRTVEVMECSPICSVESSPRSAGFPPSGIIKSPSSNDSIHCYSSRSPPEAEDPVLPPGMPPPKVLKQGNNVCEECNIIFYKYDNYVAHKKHYCAYRRHQLSILAAAASSGHEQHSSDDNNSNHSAVQEIAHGTEENSKTARSAEPFRVVKNSHSAFVCDACGVKFSSLDTLNAHQTYYCSKRADSVMSKYVKSRSENNESPSSLEPPFSGPEEWKCNYCETTCSSYETIRRHLLTHSELRGFRCLLCGYKGNTLRGMRAHACEHLSENSTSIEEFLSTTVISENDALPISRHTAELSDEDSESSKRSVSEKGEAETSRDKMSPSEAHFVEDQESNGVKVEARDSSPSHSESVNPLAFCDVVIKTEQTSSGDDESRDEHTKTHIKSEPDCDSSSQDSAHMESPPVQPISVIRCVPEKDRKDSKKNTDSSQTKPTELKYCKSCDISFYHMSNFVAHKKYYCSHPVPNCIHEAATVQ
ncbi:zinc finger protein ush isoform X2 [Parasteatoda tepidariorum]|nr:zinc finger protein ush isoform X2 [Parasteatoda tepidariorum]XP_015909390.1 zinc finger protein ush isoform X2 [Parasteatoda tepidariorum]